MTDELIQVLEEAVRKNGSDVPITIGHLLSLMKAVKNAQIKDTPDKPVDKPDKKS